MPVNEPVKPASMITHGADSFNRKPELNEATIHLSNGRIGLQSSAMTPIYLDNNATTRMDPRVADTMRACAVAGHGNPASPHAHGRRARRVVEEARESIGRLLGCHQADIHADRVLFTSGGTEANNLAILGLAGPPRSRVIVSAIEHPSIAGPAERLVRLGHDVQRLRVTSAGIVDVKHLDELLTADAPRTSLVSVMLGNNETGVIQPVAEIATRCARADVALHTDAVQAVGKIPVHFRQLGVTALSLTAHKFHGPRGIGALIVRHDAPLEPILFGGFQQAGLRPGTESPELAIGLRTALELWSTEADARAARMARLRDRFENQLRAARPEIVVIGADSSRLPHTSNIAFPGIDRQSLLMALDLAGVSCSTGSACASGSSEPSPVLLAMGLPKPLVDGSLRFSLGAETTESEIDQAVERILLAENRLQRGKG